MQHTKSAQAEPGSRRHAPAADSDVDIMVSPTQWGGGLPGVCELA